MNTSVLVTMGILFLLAFMVEALVEAVFGTLFDKMPALTPYKWALMYIAFVVGIIGAFVYRFDMLYLLAFYMDEKTTLTITTFGMTLTGLAIGRGSNFLHDIFMRWFKPVPAPEGVVSILANRDIQVAKAATETAAVKADSLVAVAKAETKTAEANNPPVN